MTRIQWRTHGRTAKSDIPSKTSVAVYLAPTMRRGEVFVPMHYPEMNRLAHPSFDPHSRQPNYKAYAVAITSEA